MNVKAGQKVKYEIYNWDDTTVDVNFVLTTYAAGSAVTWSDK